LPTGAMKKLQLQILLMLITILGVTGFQAFWLKQTYAQEAKTLLIKTDLAFRDAVQNLQVSKLKLDSNPADSGELRKLKLMPADSLNGNINIKVNAKKGIVSTINVIRKTMGDSFIKNSQLPKAVFIRKEQTTVDRNYDVLTSVTDEHGKPGRSHVFQFLYGVDSLQEPITLKEIDSALTGILKEENILVPFVVSQLDSNHNNDVPKINEVTIGLAHPVTYRLKLGNTLPYLLKQISLPILFSFLLMCITIVSFVLLYKNLLKQRRLTAIKNEFIGNITHELKTPIATVSVAIEAMKNFNALQSAERTQEYLDISSSELQRLSLLVDKVLSLSKFERNEIEIRKEKFDLVKLIQEVMESMKLQFEKKHATTSLQTTGTNFILEADQRHISSVIYNLLDNALKYSKEDPQITIHVIDQPGYLEFCVSDNGIGIPAAYNRKIFEQFFRVPHGDKHDIKGYGLGLSYVNYIVQSHQGFIEVESEPGKGSTFIVKLPFSAADIINYDKGRTTKRDINL